MHGSSPQTFLTSGLYLDQLRPPCLPTSVGCGPLPLLSRLTYNAGKSKKDFKPKAPLRRPAVAPGSSQSSVRGSVERQVQSQTQTPQPSAAQPSVLPGTVNHAASIASSSASQLRIPSQPAARIPPKSTAVPESSQPVDPIPRDTVISTSIEHTTSTSTAPPVAQTTVHHQSDSLDHEAAVEISLPTTRQPVRGTTPAQRATPAPITPSTTTEVVRRLTAEEANHTTQSSDGAGATVPRITRGQEEASSQPAAKRRKVNPPKKAVTPRQSAALEPVTTTSELATVPVAQTFERDHERNPAAATTEDGAATQSTRPKKKRQPAKVKGKRNLEDIAAAIVEDATRGRERSTNPGSKRKKRAPGRRKRAPTPEEAETVRLEPSTVKMADLCKDSRTGKSSKREKALQARDEEEMMKKKQQQENVESDGTLAPAVADGSVQASNSAPVASETRAPVPGVRIVNGQLVLDETTRTIDRVAIANEARGDDEEVVVVDALSHKVNSGTYGRRERMPKWNDELTDRFYDGLRMFGTDFGMISMMFPGKSRRTIKLKFNHEERLDNEKIKITLAERVPVDMEAFSEMSKTTYREKAEYEADMAEDRKRLEEEQAKEKEERDKVIAERAAEAASEAAAGRTSHGGDSSAKENETHGGAKGKRGGKRGKGGGTKTQKKTKVTKAAAKVPAPVR